MKPLVILVLLYIAAFAHAGEKEYVTKHCAGEIRTYKGKPRINCLTSTHAIDFVTDGSFRSGIFTAIEAAQAFDKVPGIVVIVEGDDSHLIRLQKVVAGMGIKIWSVTPLSTDRFGAVPSIGWDIPTKRALGQDLPASEISHYCVYISRNPEWPGGCSVIKTNSYPFNLQEGTHYIRVSTVDTNGDESDLSNELVK